MLFIYKIVDIYEKQQRVENVILRYFNENFMRMGLVVFNRCYVVLIIKVWGKLFYDLGVSVNSFEVFNKKCMVYNIEGFGEVQENCFSKIVVIKIEVCCQ